MDIRHPDTPNRTRSLAPHALVSALALVLAACGGSTAEPPKPTITQGVWGVLTSGCDTPDCESGPIVGTVVTAAPINGTSGSAKTGTSNDEGLWQIELPAGQYHMSMKDMQVNETDVTIGEGLVECDWESGPGGGFWQCTNQPATQ